MFQCIALNRTKHQCWSAGINLCALDAVLAKCIHNRSFDTDYNTVSGWTLEQLEHIPQVGEQFVYNGYIRVTVEEMDEQRITKLKVELLPKESQPEEEK